MQLIITKECRKWASDNLSLSDYKKLISKAGLRSSIASSPRSNGKNAGKHLVKITRLEFNIPKYMPIFERINNAT